MAQQITEQPIMERGCPCFGRELQEWRDTANMSLEQFAKAMDTTAEMVDEIERGRRPVSTQWVRHADEVLRARGRLTIEAGEMLMYHAGLVTQTLIDHPRQGAGPIRLPAEFAASAA
jgi:transcriptional regulator with XRE-family HTH domain